MPKGECTKVGLLGAQSKSVTHLRAWKWNILWAQWFCFVVGLKPKYRTLLGCKVGPSFGSIAGTPCGSNVESVCVVSSISDDSSNNINSFYLYSSFLAFSFHLIHLIITFLHGFFLPIFFTFFVPSFLHSFLPFPSLPSL